MDKAHNGMEYGGVTENTIQFQYNTEYTYLSIYI